MTSRVVVPADGGSRGWSAGAGAATTLVLLRHGVTPSTDRKVFSGNGGADPALTETGEDQARRAAAWIARHHTVDAIVASPLLRTRQTASFVAAELGLDVEIEPGVVETSFGDWDGSTFAEIMERWPAELEQWLASTAVAPPGGETFDAVSERIEATRDRLLQTHAGRTVVVVSHVTPIKMLARLALGAPLASIYAMELAPASISTVVWWPDGRSSLRSFSIVPE